MISVRVVSDNAECRALWQKMIPQEYLSDLWQVRESFHRHYQRDHFFVVAEENNQPVGLLPLSWIPEESYYGYFPGEVWHGLTWIEQNRLIARDQEVFDFMFDWLHKQKISYHLRYLLESPFMDQNNSAVDEIGYLFHPPKYDYQMDKYFEEFSRKSYKAIHKEIKNFEEQGLNYRTDCLEDFEEMIRLNKDRFGESSYFTDERFSAGFRDVMRFCHANGMLRMVTANVRNEIAAVDMGIVYNGTYTLLAGGTNENFRGIAKIINLYHMQHSCLEQFQLVDFLCGNFSWKTMFHLTPRPLYLMSNRVQG